MGAECTRQTSMRASCDLVEELAVELEAEARADGHRDVAVDDVDRLGHDVAGVEAPGRRDVAGQREAVERGQGGVGRPADAGLQHPAAPDRDAALAGTGRGWRRPPGTRRRDPA